MGVSGWNAGSRAGVEELAFFGELVAEAVEFPSGARSEASERDNLRRFANVVLEKFDIERKWRLESAIRPTARRGDG